jgi:hypothetical protein
MGMSEHPDQDLELAAAIEAVRGQLRAAQNSGSGDDVRFTVGPIELEFAIDVRREAGGEVSVKVLSLLSLGAKGSISGTQSSRVKVTLNTVAVNGQPFEVASSSSAGRPGG